MFEELPKISPPNWECETHGRHSAMMRLRAVHDERSEERHYCMFCMIERLDAAGFPQMREITLTEQEKSND